MLPAGPTNGKNMIRETLLLETSSFPIPLPLSHPRQPGADPVAALPHAVPAHSLLSSHRCSDGRSTSLSGQASPLSTSAAAQSSLAGGRAPGGGASGSQPAGPNVSDEGRMASLGHGLGASMLGDPGPRTAPPRSAADRTLSLEPLTMEPVRVPGYPFGSHPEEWLPPETPWVFPEPQPAATNLMDAARGKSPSVHFSLSSPSTGPGLLVSPSFHLQPPYCLVSGRLSG